MYYTLTKPNWLERNKKNEKVILDALASSWLVRDWGWSSFFLRYYHFTSEIKNKELCMRKRVFNCEASISDKWQDLKKNFFFIYIYYIYIYIYIYIAIQVPSFSRTHYFWPLCILFHNCNTNWKYKRNLVYLLKIQHHWCIVLSDYAFTA